MKWASTQILMAKRVNIEKQFCWNCIFARPYDVHWNRTPEGVPITKHCYEDPNNIKRGIMRNTIACKKYKIV